MSLSKHTKRDYWCIEQALDLISKRKTRATAEEIAEVANDVRDLKYDRGYVNVKGLSRILGSRKFHNYSAYSPENDDGEWILNADFVREIVTVPIIDQDTHQRLKKLEETHGTRANAVKKALEQYSAPDGTSSSDESQNTPDIGTWTCDNCGMEMRGKSEDPPLDHLETCGTSADELIFRRNESDHRGHDPERYLDTSKSPAGVDMKKCIRCGEPVAKNVWPRHIRNCNRSDA